MKKLDISEMKKQMAEGLVESGVSKDEAEQTASKYVDSMGVIKIENGKCPLGNTSPAACMYCRFGHMTDCHHPYTCEEANCSHYQSEMENEDILTENIP